MTGHELTHIIRQHFPHADDIGEPILHASHSSGAPVSYICATCEKESGFQNIYGHDPVRNPAPKGGRVTATNYRTMYLPARKQGEGMQGVGYMQLTWYALQDQADHLGGCWLPYPNIVVGARDIGGLIHVHGKQGGAARYNGVGPAAEEYGREWVKVQEFWHSRVS